MEKVSFITPLYKGNKYVNHVCELVKKNVIKAKEENIEVQTELVFVNDYPEEIIEFKENDLFNVVLFNNPKNVGIHQTRVNGLNVCTGDYILFLDQDDEIADNLLVSQFKKIQDNDIVVSNGVMDYRKTKLVLIRNKFYVRQLKTPHYFLYDHCQIVSPGQCLIRKKSIPLEWKENILKTNCSDDYLLYLLMFHKNAKFVTNEYAFLYHHVMCGSNASLNSENNWTSDLEVIDIMKKVNADINFKRMYGAALTNKYFREHRIFRYFWYMIKHPITCWSKILFMVKVAFVSPSIKRSLKNSSLISK